MKASTIKLIFPPMPAPYPVSTRLDYYIPYGMAIVTSFLKKHHCKVSQVDLNPEIINFNFKPNLSKKERINSSELFNQAKYSRFNKNGLISPELNLLADKIINLWDISKTDIAGFSVISSTEFYSSVLLAKRIKQNYKNIKIVFGGPFVTLFKHDYLNRFKFLDYLIVGEGEIPLLRLIEHINGKTNINKVPNLIYRVNGKIVKNSIEYWPIENQVEPDFDGLPLDSYRVFYNYERILLLPYSLTRGCKHRCSFCTTSYLSNYKYECKTPEKVLSELKYIMEKYHTNRFKFIGANVDHSCLELFCNSIIENKLKIKFAIIASVADLDKNLIKKMRQSGCELLIVGIESGSDRILSLMHKGFTSKHAQEILQYADSLAIIVRINLIAGYPHEKKKDIALTIKFIKSNERFKSRIVVYKFQLFYNSLIHHFPERHKVKNLYPIDHFGEFYSFDEIEGLKWKRKYLQQSYSYLKIKEAALNSCAKKRKSNLSIPRYLIIRIKIIGLFCFKRFLFCISFCKHRFCISFCKHRFFETMLKHPTQKQKQR